MILHITIEQAKILCANPANAELWVANQNALIDAHNEKQASEQYITAEEARKLGAGNVEYSLDGDDWHVCDFGCEYAKFGIFSKNEYKYRAIKQEPVEPHAELKALYAQQVKDGTLEDFVWEVDRKDYGDSYRILDTPSERPAWSEGYTYRCTPKPTCHIQSLDTGELKTMTQEAAKLLRAELGGTVEWFDADGCSAPPACVMELISEKSYTYKIKTKSLKQVWTGSREDVIALLAEFKVI